jgi:TonB-linked SusC/RagA family outer membrane protein
MKRRLLFILGCLFFTSQLFAQDVTLSLNIKNKPLVEVFKTIQEESGYRFFYSDDLVDLNKSISFEVANVGIQNVVNELEAQTSLTFRLKEDKLIVVVPANEVQESGTITGRVTSEAEPQGLPGVNVVIKGTTTGVITNFDGNFTLKVPDKYVILQFSFIGFEAQDVPVIGKSVVNVVLTENMESIDEVVVTALSIQRSKESLGYSISQIGSEEITQAKENNVMNSLAGKVAGLQISTNPSGVDGSTRVVLRGAASLKGSNRPLFVVDGVPINGGSYGGGDGIDRGDALSDINPEDVESISVLKGAGAAAAYGSRGGNGVIIITTKKGRARNGIGVSVNSSFTMQQPYIFPSMQNEYGQGAYGLYPVDMVEAKGQDGFSWSWGPKMDGQEVTNHLGEQQAFSPEGNPFKEYYQTGYSFVNSVAFSGGDAESNFRASVTNQNSEGIIPNNTLAKQTLNIRGFSKLGNAIEVDGKVTYIHHMAKNRPYISEDNASAGFAFNSMPRNISTGILRDHTTDAEGKQIWHWDQTSGNPYWNLANKRNWDERNRLQTLLSLKFNISEKLSLLTRTGFDFTNRIENASGARGSKNIKDYRGEYKNYWSNDIEWNTDALLSFKTSLSDDIKMDLNLGGNYRYHQYRSIDQGGDDWNVPDFYRMSNILNQKTGERFNEKEVWSSYFLSTLSWKNYLYFDFTYRVDVTSTIPTRDNSNVYGYHSENLSLLFTELFDMKSSILTSGKLRGSYAVVGNDTGPYKTNNYYSLGSDVINQLYPYGNIGNDLAFYDLKPEMTHSWEVGTNLEFWNNRLTVDATYYTATTKNQLMSVEQAPSTGYNKRNYNAGEVSNSGFELQLTGSPISNAGGLNWDVIVNWTKNNSEVISLSEDESMLHLKGVPMNFVEVQARVGEPYGQLYGYDYLRDDLDRIQVDYKGIPMASENKQALGNMNPDFMTGITNSFNYKNVNLSILIDGQVGGEYYSHSSLYRDLFGTGTSSLEGREEWYSTHGGINNSEELKGIYPEGYYQEGVFEGTDTPNDIAVDPFNRVVQLIGIGVGDKQKKIATDYIKDATNVRLREVVLGYTLPKRWLNNSFISGANVSLVGRNLLFLYNANNEIDPESGVNHQNVGTAIEMNSMPGSRSIGFNVNLNF